MARLMGQHAGKGHSGDLGYSLCLVSAMENIKLSGVSDITFIDFLLRRNMLLSAPLRLQAGVRCRSKDEKHSRIALLV